MRPSERHRAARSTRSDLVAPPALSPREFAQPQTMREEEPSAGRKGRIAWRRCLPKARLHPIATSVPVLRNGSFAEGFRTPAPGAGASSGTAGPAFESLVRRKPRRGRGARLVGRDLWRYGDFRIADGSRVSPRGPWRAIFAAETMMTSEFGREDARPWRGRGGRGRTDDLERTSASCSGAR